MNDHKELKIMYAKGIERTETVKEVMTLDVMLDKNMIIISMPFKNTL